MSKKLKINNKPVLQEERDKQKKDKKRKEKFKDISVEALMDYVEALEKRIEALEKKPNTEATTEKTQKGSSL